MGDSEDILNLNTSAGENFLVLNPHKKGMAFTREGGKDNILMADYIKGFYDFFDSTWTAPKIFTDWTDDKGLFSPIGFDKEGNEYFSEVTYSQGVYSSKISKFQTGGGAVEVDIPFLKNRSPHQSGCLSKDGEYMILSMESGHTNGVEDLYLVRRKSDGRWRSPVNLGSQINTEFQEITPFLAEDNRTLYFATNGRGGEGSFDIFFSVRLDESWRNWSEPKNIGTPVNTSGSETSFSFLNGDQWAYYVSSQNSDGYGDIKRIRIEEYIEEDTSQTVAETSSNQIVFKVVDKQSRLAIPAEVIYAGSEMILPNGLFIIDSILIANKELEIKSDGYLPQIISLDSTLMIGVNEVALESVSVGNTITLKNVLFYQGTPYMIEGSERELDLIVEMMNDNPEIKILLKGHTDNQGDPVLNVRLSEGRVKSVKKYLTDKGISAYRIKGIGYGGNAPIASNAEEETRKLNRRVEFEVLEN